MCLIVLHYLESWLLNKIWIKTLRRTEKDFKKKSNTKDLEPIQEVGVCGELIRLLWYTKSWNIFQT